MDLVVVVIDCSRSMAKSDALERANAFIAQRKEAERPALLEVIRFAADRIKVLRVPTPLASAAPLRESECRFAGKTALLDALVMTISMIDAQAGSGFDRISVTVATDGLDNASRSATRGDLGAAVEERLATGRWEFNWLVENPAGFGETPELIGTFRHAWQVRTLLKKFLLRKFGTRIQFDVDDLVQETMLTLFVHSTANRTSIRNLETYATTIAYRRAIEHLKNTQNHLVCASELTLLDDSNVFEKLLPPMASAEDEVIDLDERRAWSEQYSKRLLRIRKQKARQAFDLRIQGLSLDEIAKKAHITRNTVEIYVHEARKEFFGSALPGVHFSRILQT